ncbi:MAG: DUF2157 domain-containing protein [Synergistaceae bacterium]|nr:DUF2157 domain-containing protein [Synergistaceae bacterium]
MPDIRKKEMEFLSAETALWVEQKIITGEQALDILALYEVKKRSLRMILLAAGGILLGLGAISFAMAHWAELDKTLRVCMIAGANIASIVAYMFTGRSSTKTGKAFLLLAGAVMGGGLYLIPRMYDNQLALNELAGWWALGLAVTAVISRDEWQMYFAQAISLLWLNLTDAINAFALYFVRGARVPVAEFFSPVEAFGLVILLWVAWHFVRDRAAFTLNMMITVLLLASRMSLCFGGTWALVILACAGAVMSFLPGLHDTQIMGLLMLGVFGLLLTWPDFWRGAMFAPHRDILPVCNAVIVAALMLVNIYRGHSGIGITFCALLAARYFFDHFFGFMPKAWGFTLTGIIFVIAGLSFGKLRKLFEK